MIDGRGEVVRAADELSKKCITLREMSDLIGGPNAVVHCPVFVHVVASKLKKYNTRNKRTNYLLFSNL